MEDTTAQAPESSIYTWPEGWEETYESLDFLPEEMREPLLFALVDVSISM